MSGAARARSRSIGRNAPAPTPAVPAAASAASHKRNKPLVAPAVEPVAPGAGHAESFGPKTPPGDRQRHAPPESRSEAAGDRDRSSLRQTDYGVVDDHRPVSPVASKPSQKIVITLEKQ